MTQETLNTIMTMVIIPVLVAVGGFVIAYLKKKTADLNNEIEDKTVKKYVNMGTEAVLQAVETVFQTYVESLKKKGQFTKEAQQEAFNKALDIAKNLLTQEARDILSVAYGDFDLWLQTKIEQSVYQDKRLATTSPTETATTAASVAATIASTAVAQVANETAKKAAE